MKFLIFILIFIALNLLVFVLYKCFGGGVSLQSDLGSRLYQAGISAYVIYDKNQQLHKISLNLKAIRNTEWAYDINDQHYCYIVYYYPGSGITFGVRRFHFIVTGIIRLNNKFLYGIINTLDKKLSDKLTDLYYWELFLRWGPKAVEIKAIKHNRRVTDIIWKGKDQELASRLDSDPVLRNKIVEYSHINNKILRTCIRYYPKGKFGVIETENFKPENEDFEIMNIIAEHMKAAWFNG